ncbi:MAG: aminomethyltransferase family protein, partial [Pseudomonadota bacterium]
TPPRTGRIGLTHALTPTEGMLSEFTVARLAEGRAYLTSAAAAEEIDWDLLRDFAVGHDVSLRNVSEDWAVIGVMGPLARDLLQQLPNGAEARTPRDLDFDANLPWLSVQECELAGAPVRALRVSYIGELGWELHVPHSHAAPLFDQLWEAGHPLGVHLYGAFAANSMRLEKGYRAWGADLTTERSPAEAGLGAFVKSSLLERANTWDMALLEIETDGTDPFYSHPVLSGDKVIGIVTSGAFGHRTQKTLALAYLRDPERDDLSVEILGQRRRATILDNPPYDPENVRLKA